MEKEFVNGFSSWMETHHEVVAEIARIESLELEEGLVYETREEMGTGGIYELAEALTDEFENLHQGKLWGQDNDTLYFDALELFFTSKNL